MRCGVAPRLPEQIVTMRRGVTLLLTKQTETRRRGVTPLLRLFRWELDVLYFATAD